MMYSTVGAPGIRPLRSPARPEFFHRIEATFTTEPVIFTPDGLRLRVPIDGRVTRGALMGESLRGNDHFLLRPDGVVVLDMVQTIRSADRDVTIRLAGYAIPSTELELPLEAVVEPDFQWPDLAFAIIGSATFRASGELGEHLNRAVAAVDGWCNFATGGLAIETRLLPINRHVPGPLVRRAEPPRASVDRMVTGQSSGPSPSVGTASVEPLAPAVPLTERPVSRDTSRAVA